LRSQSEAESEAALTSDSKSGSIQLVDQDGDSAMDSDDDSDSTTTELFPLTSSATPTYSQPIGIDTSNPEVSSSPIPPSFTSIGSPEIPTPLDLQSLKGMLPEKSRASPNQLESLPGDEFSGAAKVEGMMDTRESPLRL